MIFPEVMENMDIEKIFCDYPQSVTVTGALRRKLP